MKVIVIISAMAEWEGVKPLFPDVRIENFPYGEFFHAGVGNLPVTFFHAGWGKTASAGALQYLVNLYAPDLVVNLGTCGGFVGSVQLGDVILVERTFMYDIVELMADLNISDYYASALDLNWLAEPHPYPARRGTIASADGDLLPHKIPFLKSQGAIAADWESAALAWVARKNNARLLILRGVSDMVNEQGGEAYDNIEVFNERAREIMRRLVAQLPDWLKAVKV